MFEFQNCLRNLANGKAAGQSSITAEHLKHMPLTYQVYLLDLLNKCLLAGNMPTEWKNSSLYLIPKDPNMTNNIKKTRPIALLEIPRKLFFKLIHYRCMNAINQCGGLPGNNSAFTKGISTFDSIISLKSIIDDANVNQNFIYIVSTDIARAYDSVPWIGLELSLRRIKMPGIIIKLFENLLQHRKAQVITPYGLTDGFYPTVGIDQGDSMAPLMWNIFFDVILCRLKESYYGITLQSTNIAPITVPYLAYADDVILIADNQQSLQNLTNILIQSLSLWNIRLNYEKCAVHSNSAAPIESIHGFHMGARYEISPRAPNPRSLKYLGCLIPLTSGQEAHIIKEKKKELAECISLLRPKQITGKIFSYLITCVIQPKLVYSLMATPLLNDELRQ